MNVKEICVAIICLSLIPLGLVMWISNVNARETTIRDLTLMEYVQETQSGFVDNSIYEEEINIEELADSDGEGEEESKEPLPSSVKIVMNFAGDCTIGSDSNYGYKNTFYDVYDQQQGNYSYFFENMQSLFANDDITVVNFEGTLTDYKVKTPKEFNFRAPPEYANVILSGDIQAVNLANNHTKDYGQTGYDDTLKTLEEYGIPYFGYDNYYIFEKDGIKIGFAGLTAIWDGTIEKRIDNAIAYFDENSCNAKVFTFHWGNERVYKQNEYQKRVGHYAIDHGVDLIVGHHPHVVQGIEEYNGKYIVYSLGNFCFGGNTNPQTKIPWYLT